jgi:transposase-like protein
MSKAKYSPAMKQQIIEEYKSGTISRSDLKSTYGMNPDTIYKWLQKYELYRVRAFIKESGNTTYTKEFKIKCVEEYIRGHGSLIDISSTYNISSSSVLLNGVKCYNANKELKDYNPKMEVYMADSRRKTTIEERKEIVEYCINHKRNYKDTAALFNVSYSQVYSWVKKYDLNGEDGLSDKRGQHKADDEIDELERLRRENLTLKRQLEEKDMLTELLKKVKEFEGM